MIKNILSFQKLGIVLFVILLISVNILFADDDHNLRIEDVLSEIRTELSLDVNEKINPDNVPDNLLEQLGEAVMNEMQPNESVHEYMDNMMGGEGSDDLKRTHRIMGYNYLSGYHYGRGRYWMNAPMMRMGMSRGMMWNGGYGRFRFFPGGLIMGIIFIILIIGAVFIVIAVLKKGNIYNETDNNETALDILKKRYAKGEIAKKEYEDMKKDIL